MCDYSFSQKGNLKQHVVIVHENKKPFKCEVCDYSCSLKGNLKSHVASVHEKRNHLVVKYVTIVVFKKVT